MIKSHVETKTSKVTFVDAVVCDLCKKEYPGADGVDWKHAAYEHLETSITYHDHVIYPDDWYTNEKITVHLCPDCFKNRLIPWLKSEGADVRVEGDV